MEKKFKLCQHNEIRCKCPICQDDVEEKRIDMLVNDESKVGKDIE